MDISILGTSATREIFNLYENKFDVRDYYTATTLISLISNPLNIDIEQLDGKSEFRKRNVYNDLNKVLFKSDNTLLGEYLIIDLINESLNLLEIEQGRYTESNELIESSILDNYEFKRVLMYDIGIDIWKEAADIFISEISKKYHPKKVIIHKALLAEKYIEDGCIRKFSDSKVEEIKAINKRLEQCYEYIKYNMPGVNILDIPTLRIANKEHKWGLTPYNYIDKYYENALEKIYEILGNLKIFKGEQIYTSIKPVKYLFKEAKIKNKDKLLIIFSAFNSTKEASYNYVRTLNRYDCNKLFILDDYGDVGTYYTGIDGSLEIESAVISLITYYMSIYDIRLRDVITIGSSKGGTAALYYGIKYNMGKVIAGALQYKVGSYLNTLKDKSTATALMGENYEANIIKYDSFIRKCLNKSIKTDINIITGVGDWQYKPFLEELFSDLKHNNINYNLKLIDIKNHNDISIYFPDYIYEKLNDVLENVYEIYIDYIYRKIVIKLNIQKELECAFYLYKDKVRIDVDSYKKRTYKEYNYLSKGIYTIKVFIIIEEEKLCFENEIEISN